uniref:DNAJC9 HTH domain-containing protein n=1 Tax=Anopheles farauti TaxID=69004 RepID=A0A182QLH3_9DIPT
MSTGTLDICEKYYGTRNIYELFGVEKTVTEQENEPRIAEIVQKMIDAKEVPEYAIFTKEPKAKRDRRHKKYAREAKEAEEIVQQQEMASLEQQIVLKRKSAFSSLIESLEAKYGNNEDENDVFEAPPKKRKTQKGKRDVNAGRATAKASKGTPVTRKGRASK